MLILTRLPLPESILGLNRQIKIFIIFKSEGESQRQNKPANYLKRHVSPSPCFWQVQAKEGTV
jgi:hypothetical protein